MKTLRFKVFGFAAIALLLAATVVSCGDDDEKTPPTPPTEQSSGSEETEGSIPTLDESIGGEDSLPEDSIPEDSSGANIPVDISYIGGEYGNSQYFKKYLPTLDVVVNMTNPEAGLDNIYLIHYSPVWGIFVFRNLEINKNSDGTYTINGEGTAEVKSEHSNDVMTYIAYVSGTLTGDKLVATFSIPSLMGGFELLFNPDDFDEVLNNPNNNGSTR